LALQKRLLARAVPATAASARFVTVEAYEAAGGTLATQDLFVDETMLTDPDLLERLKNEKLARWADAIRRDEGWGVLVDPDLVPSLRRAKSDFLAEEMERLKEIDDRLGAEGLESTWRRLVDERAGIQRLAALRAVERSERHRYGLAVTLDDDGLFVVRALILPRRENQTDVPAAGDQSPLATAEAGAPPFAGSPSAASTPAADGTISADEHDWGDASGLSEAAFAAAAARAAVARVPSPPRDDEAPLPVAARRICETAETKTISDVIAGDLRFAKEAHVAACARPGPHTGPVGIVRDHGPWNCKHPLLLAIARAATYRERLALAAAASDVELDLAFCATVAMAADLRDSTRRDDQAALRKRAEQRLSPPPPIGPTMIARLVENFDYLGFFCAAKRQLTLRALNDVGGVAMETENEWRNDEGLAVVAATVARGARWLPEVLRAPPPSPAPVEAASRSSIAMSTK
jgi:hypothetical protein